LMGELDPDQGQIKHGTNLVPAVFDQNRTQLDPEMTLWDSLTGDPAMRVSGKADQVLVRGAPKHVVGYLKEFLFDEAQARAPVRSLSGGEKARLLLAKIMARESNLLVLDEPTNDLDVETLDLLQELLDEYQGTVILVSHDRAFIDNVVTSTLAFEGRGVIKHYIGGYNDWLRQRNTQSGTVKKTQRADQRAKKTATKLSYKDQRELDNLPQQIESLEKQISKISQQICEPDFYRGERQQIQETEGLLKELQQQLDHCYQRWEKLENL